MSEEKISGCNWVGIGLVAALVALALGIWAATRLLQPSGPPPFELSAGTLLNPPKVLQPFRLQDTGGGSFTPESRAGRWTLLSFGYTHCPDVCPTTLGVLKAVDEQLDKTASASGLDIVFVSIDPERDTLERLREYLAYFNPDFLGATGEDQALRGLADQLGVLYARADVESAMGYLMDHSAHLVLLVPKVRMYALFGPPFSPAKIAEDLAGILAQHSTDR